MNIAHVEISEKDCEVGDDIGQRIGVPRAAGRLIAALLRRLDSLEAAAKGYRELEPGKFVR